MGTHSFTIVLDRQPTDGELDELCSIGCDDAAFGTEGGVPTAEFDRETSDLPDAIASAVRALEAVNLSPLRVVDQDLLTLADLADRIGQSRESVRRYAQGSRGPGGFPPPVNPAREGTTFYRWSEAAPWFTRHLGIDVAENDSTLVVANLVLQARRLREHVTNMPALAGLLAD